MEVLGRSSDFEIESMYCEGCVVDAVEERRPSIARETKRKLANYLLRADDIRVWIWHNLTHEWELDRRRKGQSQEQVESKGHLHEFVYGRGPEELGYKGEYELMERASAEQRVRAFQCKTWSEYAQLQGMSWEEAREAWWDDDEVTEWGEKVPNPEDELRYSELFGHGYLFDLDDPREEAYDLLIDEIPWEEDPVLAASIEIQDGYRLHVQAIIGTSREGMERLAEIINDYVPGGATLQEDQALIAAAYGLSVRG